MSVEMPVVESYRLALSGARAGRRHVLLARRGGDGTGREWAIVEGGCCLADDFEWEFEGLPSSRTDEFLARTRMTLDEALARWDAFLERHAAGEGFESSRLVGGLQPWHFDEIHDPRGRLAHLRTAPGATAVSG